MEIIKRNHLIHKSFRLEDSLGPCKPQKRQVSVKRPFLQSSSHPACLSLEDALASKASRDHELVSM